MNTKIRQFEDTLLSVVNSSDLDLEIKRLVLSDLLNLVTRTADKAIQKEVQETNAESAHECQLAEFAVDEYAVKPDEP